MDNSIASVIVPAYNTEEYIAKMIECVSAQTYRYLQIIFIDDGSTDKTAEIIKSYATKDRRIEYYYQNNMGVSAARNLGLKKAEGKKIFLFDSDDTFEADLIEKCLVYSETNDVESVLFGYGNKVGDKIRNEHVFQLDGIYRGMQIAEKVIPCFLGHSYEDVNNWIRKQCDMREGKEHTALWRIMLDSAVIQENNLQFDPELSLGEDTKFMNTYLLFSKSIGILKETLYYLTIREDSANATSNKNPELMAKNKEKLILARTEIDAIAQMHGVNTHAYWQGTLVFSAVQLAVRLAHYKHGWKTYKQYMSNRTVQQAIRKYKPYIGSVRSIPFVILKMKLNWLLYGMIKMIPESITDHVL